MISHIIVTYHISYDICIIVTYHICIYIYAYIISYAHRI